VKSANKAFAAKRKKPRPLNSGVEDKSVQSNWIIVEFQQSKRKNIHDRF